MHRMACKVQPGYDQDSICTLIGVSWLRVARVSMQTDWHLTMYMYIFVNILILGIVCAWEKEGQQHMKEYIQ